MRKLIAIMAGIMLVFGVAAVSGCQKRESDAGKKIKHTMDRAQDAVDKVNQRQKDSVPDEEGH